MRTQGSPDDQEHRRLLAIRRLREGDSTGEVAEFLEVDPRTVRRCLDRFRRDGEAGLRARPVPGRPPKLTATPEKIIRRWLSEDPLEHGFATELWTGPRRAQLIRQEFGIRLDPRYLSTWMRARGFTPQTPPRVARDGDPEQVAAGLKTPWPRIKKRPAGSTPRSS